ncbi:MAG: YihY/virulence factor BrkB family protein [Micrococcaceae bacterium]
MEPINPLLKQDLNIDALKKRAVYNQARRTGKGAMAKFSAWTAWLTAVIYSLVPVRVFNHFTRVNGSVISAGVAFYFFFSGVAALSGIFAVFALVLNHNPGILNTVTNAIASAAPGFIKTPSHPEGLLDPKSLLNHGTGFSLTAILSLVLTLFTGLNVLKYLRLGIRAMFNFKPPTTNFAVQKIKDIVGLLLIGLTIVISSVVSLVTGKLLDTVLHWLNIEQEVGGFAFKVLPIIITLLVDMSTILIAVKFISGVKVPWKFGLIGALVGAIAMSVLRSIGTAAVTGTINKYPALSAFAVPLILLLWFNVISEIILISASTMKVLWADKESKEKREWIRNPVKVARSIRRQGGNTPHTE